MKRIKWLVPALYIVVPDAADLLAARACRSRPPTRSSASFTLWPRNFTLENYRKIFTEPTWYTGYINSLIYVVINTVLSVAVALPAAYAFSRYRFLGDKHLFFWLLSNRMAPAAVFALPFFQLYSAVGLFDTHIAVALAHCLFNVPARRLDPRGLHVRGAEGAGRARVRRRLFVLEVLPSRFFLPAIAAGIGVAAFFCFMFSWVELLLAKTLTSVDGQADRGDDDAHREHVRLRARPAGGGRRADDRARRVRDLLRAQLHREGILARPRLTRVANCECTWGRDDRCDLSWMAWTWQTAAFFACIALLLVGMSIWEWLSPGGAPRRGILAFETTRGDRLFISLLAAAYIHLIWLALFGTPLWGATALSLVVAVIVFRWV